MSDRDKDYLGRVWMHCEEGLNLSKASMGRFVFWCLKNNVKIGDIWAFNPTYDRSSVIVSVRLKPEQFKEFELETKGKLKEPPVIHVN